MLRAVTDPLTPTSAARAAKAISRADPDMARFIDVVGPFSPRPPLGDYFSALVRSIAFQQLAGRAAAAILGRFVASLNGRLTPEGVAGAGPDVYRAAGFSGAKEASLRSLAGHVLDGTLPLEGLEAYSDDEIVERLVAVRGIGRWTAEMFLLFQLGRPDVWPVDDFAVRKGYGIVHRLAEAPKPKELQALGEVYRPYRSVAAWYLWRATDTVLPEE
jgi:DNA-3-methyladenine glycosylase II